LGWDKFIITQGASAGGPQWTQVPALSFVIMVHFVYFVFMYVVLSRIDQELRPKVNKDCSLYDVSVTVDTSSSW